MKRERAEEAALVVGEMRARRDGGSAFVPHRPHPRQREFLALGCREALYGGAAGGGKSDALLMAALQCAHVPSYSALLLRRTYADLALPGAIMDRARTWLAGKAAWNDRDKRFTFPSGATLTFGFLDSEADRYRYQSAEFQFIGFDELTQFPELWYRYMFSRLRRAQGVDVPLRMRAATNPGGIGHEWVRRRFMPDRPGVSLPKGRRFVPARLTDNPSLDRKEYTRALAQLDQATRRQLEEGLWERSPDGLVYPCPDAALIDAAPACSHHLLGIDFGVTDATAFSVIGWREDDPRVYVLEAWGRTGMSPSDAGDAWRALDERYHFDRVVGDVGGLGKAFAEEMRRRFHAPVLPAEKRDKRGHISLFVGDLERGRIRVVRSTCGQLLDEWAELPWHPSREREAEGFANHVSDATLYVWRSAAAWTQQEPPPPPTPEEATRAEESAIWDGLEAQASREWWDQ